MGLQRQAETPAPAVVPWLKAHMLGLICLGIGLAAVAVASALYFGGGGDQPRIPDFRITTPFLVVSLVLAVASVVRRERAWALPVSGVGLAACAMVLGWAVVIGVIVLITAVVILVMSKVM
jgi:hypothetical protein